MALERVSKDARQIIPDVIAIKRVREDELGSTRVQAVGGGGDLQSLAACDGVLDEFLAVGTAAGLKGNGRRDGGPDGPESDGETALIVDDGGADGVGDSGCQGGRDGRGGEGEEGGELHFCGWLGLVWVEFGCW